ncbi:MAG: hypothetical protein HQM03_21230, partial [Magnetococcales bacterium]|nr:hypothetical protein [Magnetococcales bacterium]
MSHKDNKNKKKVSAKKIELLEDRIAPAMIGGDLATVAADLPTGETPGMPTALPPEETFSQPPAHEFTAPPPQADGEFAPPPPPAPVAGEFADPPPPPAIGGEFDEPPP